MTSSVAQVPVVQQFSPAIKDRLAVKDLSFQLSFSEDNQKTFQNSYDHSKEDFNSRIRDLNPENGDPGFSIDETIQIQFPGQEKLIALVKGGTFSRFLWDASFSFFLSSTLVTCYFFGRTSSFEQKICCAAFSVLSGFLAGGSYFYHRSIRIMTKNAAKNMAQDVRQLSKDVAQFRQAWFQQVYQQKDGFDQGTQEALLKSTSYSKLQFCKVHDLISPQELASTYIYNLMDEITREWAHFEQDPWSFISKIDIEKVKGSSYEKGWITLFQGIEQVKEVPNIVKIEENYKAADVRRTVIAHFNPLTKLNEIVPTSDKLTDASENLYGETFCREIFHIRLTGFCNRIITPEQYSIIIAHLFRDFMQKIQDNKYIDVLDFNECYQNALMSHVDKKNCATLFETLVISKTANEAYKEWVIKHFQPHFIDGRGAFDLREGAMEFDKFIRTHFPQDVIEALEGQVQT